MLALGAGVVPSDQAALAEVARCHHLKCRFRVVHDRRLEAFTAVLSSLLRAQLETGVRSSGRRTPLVTLRVTVPEATPSASAAVACQRIVASCPANWEPSGVQLALSIRSASFPVRP